MELALTVNGVAVIVDLPGVEEEALLSAREVMIRDLQIPLLKNQDIIAACFMYLLATCPDANPSDLWHHVAYRLYVELFPRHRAQNPQQSWVRASGEALEQVIARIYAPVLAEHNIIIEALTGRRRRAVLTDMGLDATVGRGKLDVALHLRTADNSVVFGGVHAKASLAERVSDDIPASRAMMGRGFFSPLWTLDVKSFPPPRGNLVNRGELGSPERPSEKRRYIEEHGDFDHCYSANTRTVPSSGSTTSGKNVYRLNLSAQPDQFALDTIAEAARRR